MNSEISAVLATRVIKFGLETSDALPLHSHVWLPRLPPTKSCNLRLLNLFMELLLSAFAYTQMLAICIYSTNLKLIAKAIHTLYRVSRHVTISLDITSTAFRFECPPRARMFELFDHLSHLSCLSSISSYIYISIFIPYREWPRDRLAECSIKTNRRSFDIQSIRSLQHWARK